MSASSFSKRQKDILKPHQEKVVRRMLSDDSRGIVVYHTVGSGKSLTSIGIAENMMNKHIGLKTVVICPAPLKANYEKELAKWKVNESRYTIYSFETFARIKKDVCKKKLLIVDEAHRIRNPPEMVKKRDKSYSSKNVITYKVLKCAESAFKVVFLTGTPVHNYPSDMATLMYGIEGKLPTSQLRDIFTKKISIRKHFNDMMKCKVSYYKPSGTEAEEHFPKVIYKDKVVKMGHKQFIAYQAFEDIQLDNDIMESLMNTTGLLNINSLRAFSNGARRFCNVVEDEHPKIDALVDNVINMKGRHLIYSTFKGQGLHIIEDMLKKHKKKVVLFTGDIPLIKRKKIVEDFNEGVYDALLISSAGAEGLDLKKTTSVHILEPHWNNEKIEQVIGRAVRYDSHKGLPKEKQVVEVYQYYAKKPMEQMSVKTPKSLKITNSMPEKVRNMLMKHDIKAFDKNYLEGMMSEPVVVPTLDIYLKNMSKIKKHINKEFLERVKDVSIEKQECGTSNEKLSFK